MSCHIQVFIEAKKGTEGEELERELFIIRKLIEKKKFAEMGDDAADFYVASLSDKTIVYKVMVVPRRYWLIHTTLMVSALRACSLGAWSYIWRSQSD